MRRLIPVYGMHLSVSQTLKPYLSLPQAPAALLGMEWYPFATSQRPETFCFVRSVRDVPVALVDGFTGKVRLSLVSSTRL